MDGEERVIRGHVSPPFGAFRGHGTGTDMTRRHIYRLVFVPAGRVLATLRSFRDRKALASELARLWVRGDGTEPGVDVRMAADALRR